MIDWFVAFHTIVVKMCVQQHWLSGICHHPRKAAVEHNINLFLMYRAKDLGKNEHRAARIVSQYICGKSRTSKSFITTKFR